MEKDLFMAWAIFVCVFLFVVFVLSKYIFKVITAAAVVS